MNQGVGAISDVIDIHGEGKEDGCQEIPFVSFSTILAATEGFSQSNLLGRGGFGPVYKVSLLHRVNRSNIFIFLSAIIILSKKKK